MSNRVYHRPGHPDPYTVAGIWNLKTFTEFNIPYIGNFKDLFERNEYLKDSWIKSSYEQMRGTNQLIFNKTTGKEGPLFPNGPFPDQVPFPVGGFKDESFTDPRIYNEKLAEWVISVQKEILGAEFYTVDDIVNNRSLIRIFKVFMWIVSKRVYLSGNNYAYSLSPITNTEYAYCIQLFNEWINHSIAQESAWLNMISKVNPALFNHYRLGNEDVRNEIRLRFYVPFIKEQKRIAPDNDFLYY